jgi:hypothetical protein
MAVKFIDAVRVNPAPCGHFDMTIEFDDLVQRTKQVSIDQIAGIFAGIEDLIPGNDPEVSRDAALALLWIDYQRRHGKGIAAMRDEIIVEPLP